MRIKNRQKINSPNCSITKSDRHAYSYLDEFGLPRVCEGGVHVLVLLHRVLCVEGVHAQVAEGGAEEVFLRAVLKQGALKGRGCDLGEQSLK